MISVGGQGAPNSQAKHNGEVSSVVSADGQHVKTPLVTSTFHSTGQDGRRLDQSLILRVGEGLRSEHEVVLRAPSPLFLALRPTLYHFLFTAVPARASLHLGDGIF